MQSVLVVALLRIGSRAGFLDQLGGLLGLWTLAGSRRITYGGLPPARPRWLAVGIVTFGDTLLNPLVDFFLDPADSIFAEIDMPGELVGVFEPLQVHPGVLYALQSPKVRVIEDTHASDSVFIAIERERWNRLLDTCSGASLEKGAIFTSLNNQAFLNWDFRHTDPTGAQIRSVWQRPRPRRAQMAERRVTRGVLAAPCAAQPRAAAANRMADQHDATPLTMHARREVLVMIYAGKSGGLAYRQWWGEVDSRHKGGVRFKRSFDSKRRVPARPPN
jgi:hypothetical protein